MRSFGSEWFFVACVSIPFVGACSASSNTGGGGAAVLDDSATTLPDGSVGSDAPDSTAGDPDGGLSVDFGFVPDTGGGVLCDGAATTVSGVVYSPAKIDPDPLYNALVYIPSGDLEPFKPGASCDRCGTLSGGKARTVALTGPDGKFTLKDVPIGADVPLVIQLGRWRRKVTIPRVTACTDTPLPSELTRLPRNQREGDIPLMAIATGIYDHIECVIRKMGIDDAEFTLPTATPKGRVHLFKEMAGGGDLGPETFLAESLWNRAEKLKAYDVVLFPCETDGIKPTEAYKNLIEYTSSGGRVMATDLAQHWIKDAPAPFPATATWSGAGGRSPLPAKVDMTFPKGKAMAEWLKNVGATPTLGDIRIDNPFFRLSAVDPKVSQRWIYATGPDSVQHYSFNTPVGAKAEDQCGKVIYSSFHVLASPGSGTRFPGECGASTKLSAQEKVIEFMLLDLASCVQKDDEVPKPPVIK